MKWPRTVEQCIICLQKPPFPSKEGFTEEHIIPDALGGVLSCEFLCKPCNDRFGHTFEGGAKTDPAIRRAIYALRDDLPMLYKRIEERQRYKLASSGNNLPGSFRSGRIIGKVSKLGNDLWVSAEETESVIRSKLSRSGMTIEEIDQALFRYTTSPEQTPVELGNGIVATSHPTYIAGQDFSKGKPITELLALKIAYEFMALRFGAPILANIPILNEIRRALLQDDANSYVLQVESLLTKERKYKPFHGIAFEGNSPNASIQIRLFGALACRVSFPGLAMDSKPFHYTHDLETGREYCNCSE